MAPRHRVAGGDGGGALPERLGRLVRRSPAVLAREVDPHEEVILLAVAELLVVDDVAAVVHQEASHGVHDARRLGAVEGQHVFDGGVVRGSRVFITRRALGSSRTTTDFDVGVLLCLATEPSGTRGLVSG
ncbi:MAG: hypothetical protein JWO11_4290 [Nocardioides sp.]|nr:hypothetical protein [Nocardioides sp.]